MLRGSIQFPSARWLTAAVAIFAVACGASEPQSQAADAADGFVTTSPAPADGPADSESPQESTPDAATKPAPLVTPDEPTSVYQGVYTAAQAARGKSIFDVHCIQCHQVTQFAAGSLRIDERYGSLGDLFLAVTTLMPMDDPGGLPYADYSAIISHFLSSMDLPEGTRELSADINDLLPIGFDPPADAE